MDYAAWLRRAVEFTEGLGRLPGRVEIKAKVAPPLSDAEYRTLADACRLPIPDLLRRFWMEASGHCHCTYSWDIPAAFKNQLEVAFPHWSGSYIWGGAEFEPSSAFLDLVDECLEWVDGLQHNDPKDARYWQHSLPLVPVGNGDYAALYVKDNPENPPVVYLCHEGYGGSGVIAHDFDEFLIAWEDVGYVGIHFLGAFLNERTRAIEPNTYPVEKEAVQSLFRGESRPDLVKPPFVMTHTDWLACVEPDTMLDWLEEQRRLNNRKLRLFSCACCRRVWDQMGERTRTAVEVAESFADGRASDAELQAARSALSRGFELTLTGAAYSAVDGNSLASWNITCHLDEPELQLEKAAHADLIRHIFGDPFHAPAPVAADQGITELATRLYDGEPCGDQLHSALQAAGHDSLADHFLRPDHPKGCWALDLILGR